MKVAWTFWQVIPFLKLKSHLNVILNLMLVIHFTFWFNINSGIFTRFFLYSRVNIESCTSTLWNWTTNILWSQFINGKSVWTSILWFRLDFWANFDSQCWLSTLLSQISESVSVFIPVPFESKSIISQNHTSLLDKDIEENDSVIIFENWKLDGGNFFNKIIQFSNILLGRIRDWWVPVNFTLSWLGSNA